MNAFRNTLASITLGLAALATVPVEAATVKITFTSDIVKSSLPGVDAGDTLVLDLLVDNGGSGLLGQSWDLDDVISGTVRVGSLTQTYTGDWWTEDGNLYPAAGFRTDATGVLEFAQFYGMWDPWNLCMEQDIDLDDCQPAYRYVLVADSIYDVDDQGAIAFFNEGWSGYESLYPQGRWSIAEVPLPGTLPLLGIGLLGLGLARRRAA